MLFLYLDGLKRAKRNSFIQKILNDENHRKGEYLNQIAIEAKQHIKHPQHANRQKKSHPTHSEI
jgi:allantoicase